MSAESVALIPQCAECEAPTLVGTDLDEPAELFFYCPRCAEQEFDHD